MMELPEGWEVKKLKDVCEKITDGTHQTPKYFESGVIFLSSRNVTSGKIDWSNIKYIDEKQHLEMQKRVSPKKGDILLAKNGTTGVAAMVDKDVDFDIYVSLAWLRSKGEITPDYLLYFVNSPIAKKQFNSKLKGIGVPNLHLEEIREVQIPFPSSLYEQTEIIERLNSFFQIFDRAKANLEKNLQNAKDLFQSELNRIFSEKGEDWAENKLKDVTTKIGSGATPRGGKESYKEEGISLIRSMNVHDTMFVEKNLALIDETQARELNNVTLEENDVLLNITGASVARSCVVPANFLPARVNQHVSIIRAKTDILDPIFLNLLLVSKPYKDQLLATGEKGATRQAITKAQIESFEIQYPNDLKIQKDIIKSLENIKTLSQRLQSHYTQKLQNLEELKKSILQKAFTGQLTKQIKAIPEFSAKERHAAIVALAYHSHFVKSRLATFQHVKSEKIVHIVESKLKIEMGRKAYKGEYGPNDFPAQKTMETWAKREKIFSFEKIGESYNFQILENFDSFISKAKIYFDEDTLANIERLIDVFIPLKARKAEVVATVYAAWNNLLILGQEVSPEAIVMEARENWHESKMKIKREEFFDAISTLRDKNLIPDGSGKLVAAKA